ncbi:MAG: ArsC family reductase [Thiotrichaceae bacterium]|nr:ArsC family reductase [Thiotrichaceae bacterium]
MITLYGIKNCDTVRKACKWLDANGVEYHYHDVRKDGLSATKIKQWTKSVDWELLLNRRGLTWRQLSDDEKANLNKSKAVRLMAEKPTLIKRPVLEMGTEAGDAVMIGFKEETYQTELL